MSIPPPNKSIPADLWTQHLAVCQAALERGWLRLDGFADRLRQLGGAAADMGLSAFWLDVNLLSPEQLSACCRDCGFSFDPGEAYETISQDSTLIFKSSSRSSQDNPSAPASNSSGNAPALNRATLPAADDDVISDFPTQVRSDTSKRASSDDPWVREIVYRSRSGSERKVTLSQRYIIEEEVGRGGSGRVFRVRDRDLQRIVAMKVVRTPENEPISEARIERFLIEARATGRLEHPNIIPIYDVGVLPGGDVYYTMKFIRRHSLREVIRQLGVQDETIRREYSLTELLQIFLPVCQAVHYAHAQGIVHRDLKPDNIMLGDYGEVLVTDWGLARMLEDPAEQFDTSAPSDIPQTLGTPAYMSPEQAMGQLDRVDELSDIYSLGALLYEILTLRPPFEGPSARAVIEMVAAAQITRPRQRAPGRHIPQDLESICLKALSTDRRKRYTSAKALNDAVVSFLDGLQQREAQRKIYLGRSSSRDYFNSLNEIKRLNDQTRSLRGQIEDWQSPAHKKPLWRAEDDAKRARVRMGRAYSDSVRAFTQALAYDPDARDAKQGLTTLYWSRFLQSEQRNVVHDQIHFDALIRQNDPDGHFHELLEGDGVLDLTSDPPGARVSLYRHREFDRVQTPSEPVDCGATPVHLERLPMGSYLAIIEAPGYATTRYPIHITRTHHWQGHVRMLRAESIPEGFVFVPSGAFISGGDPQALNSGPREHTHADDFLIARHPVTFGEYMAFLDDLQAIDPALAEHHAPAARGGDGMLAELRDGHWVPLESILIEGEATHRYPPGEGHAWRLPICCVSAFDALAYIDWRSRRDGYRYRLLHAHEWEKAARGVDGRFFPWGDSFDATFCKMHQSRPEASQPEPVGVFETDRSVYGADDLAGTIQEWCRDHTWVEAAQAAVDSPPLGSLPDEHPPEDCPIRGGSWSLFESNCRVSNRFYNLAVARVSYIGFRIGLSVGPHGPQHIDEVIPQRVPFTLDEP